MKVRFTPRALEEAQRKKSWWQMNRDEQTLVDEEIAETVRELDPCDVS